MKKQLTLLLMLFVLILSGCALSQDEEKTEYQLYFRKIDLSAAAGRDALYAQKLPAEQIPEGDCAQTAKYLMQQLLNGPEDVTLTSAIPFGTKLVSFSVERGRAVVDLSSSYAILSGINLTLADAAIVMTLTQLPEISSVQIKVNGHELVYRDRQVFWEEDMLLSLNEDVVGTLDAVLYFPRENGWLVPENRMLELYEGDTQAETVVKALEEKPQTKDLLPAQPKGFKVQGVWTEEETCYVNLSSALLVGMEEEPPLKTTLLSLARSLCSLDAVEEVRFLVDGEFADRYGGVDISRVFVGFES